MESKHPGGRPLLFTDVEELKQRIDAYFLEMDREAGDLPQRPREVGHPGALSRSRAALSDSGPADVNMMDDMPRTYWSHHEVN